MKDACVEALNGMMGHGIRRIVFEGYGGWDARVIPRVQFLFLFLLKFYVYIKCLSSVH
jgi:hypothetical protein